MYTMQALWELKALKLFLSTLATSAFKHVLHIVWLILLLLQHPMSWLLPQFSMTIVAGMQVPMALLEAATRHEIASATPAARALQWQRCFVHALIFWVKDCSVAYGLASLARSAAHHPSHCKVCNANLPPQTCAMPPGSACMYSGTRPLLQWSSDPGTEAVPVHAVVLAVQLVHSMATCQS